ncbi:MAG: hypothetical protein LBF81_06535 [Prevotellaceae bacterium]|jgi:hypothetical protein|nr:hypothetical protein [Prevotellaceae bacterium]
MDSITPLTRVRNEASLVEINRKYSAILQDNNTIYIGYAWPGTSATDEPMWLIERLTVNEENGMILRMYPDGNTKQFIYKFSECKTYDYYFAK